MISHISIAAGWWRILAYSSVLFFGVAYLLYDLGGPALMDYDEAAYAMVVEDTVASGNYLMPSIDGRPWFDKPPLYLNTLMVSQAFIDDPEWAYRIPGVLFALGSLVLIMLLLYALTQSHAAAVISGIVLMSTPGFIEAAREVRFDVPVIFWMLVAWYAGLRALTSAGKQETSWFAVIGVAIGLALMTKSVVGILPLVVIIPLLFLSKGVRLFTERNTWYAAVAAIGIAAPWHLYMSVVHGMEFWRSYLGVHVVERYTENLFANTATNMLYSNYLLSFAMPWLAVALLSAIVVALLRHTLARADLIYFFSFAIGGLAIAGIFYAAETKVVHYLTPLFPIVAIIVAFGLHLIHTRLNAGRFANICMIGGLVLVGAYGAHQTQSVGYRTEGHFAFDQAIANDERAIASLVIAEDASRVFFTHDVYYETVRYYSGVETVKYNDAGVRGDLVVSFKDAPVLARPHETVFTGTHLRLFKIE